MHALNCADYTHRVLNRTFEPEAEERYAAYKRVKLREQVLKRIVNQIVSQSVSKPPLIAINTYTKYFAGEIVERARDVQEEYAKAYDKLLEEKWRERDKIAEVKKEQQQKPKDGEMAPIPQQPTTNGVIKTEEDSSASQNQASLNGSTPDTTAGPSTSTTEPSASSATTIQEDQMFDKVRKLPPPPHPLTSLSDFENPHRGGLLPEHLREALRRYRNDGEGGGVGFDGMSLGGLGVKGRRTWTVGGTFSGQGRRLFK